jgi:hypothetical protein
MAEAQRRPEKRVIIDALVLAFSHSEIRSVVGTDALRSVLEVEFKDMMSKTTFDLEQLWDLLLSQPGFTAEAAVPPMCLFKSWEQRLGIEVKLPAELGDLSESDRASRAIACQVPAPELRKVLREPDAARTSGKLPAVPRARNTPSRSPAGSGGFADRFGAERRRTLMIAASVIALVCFVFVAITVWRAVRVEAKWQDFPAGAIAGQLPVAEPERLGDEVAVSLTDPGWMARAQGEREEQLRVALESLRSKGVQVLFVRHDGAVRAAARFERDGSIRYRFY